MAWSASSRARSLFSVPSVLVRLSVLILARIDKARAWLGTSCRGPARLIVSVQRRSALPRSPARRRCSAISGNVMASSTRKSPSRKVAAALSSRYSALSRSPSIRSQRASRRSQRAIPWFQRFLSHIRRLSSVSWRAAVRRPVRRRKSPHKVHRVNKYDLPSHDGVLGQDLLR